MSRARERCDFLFVAHRLGEVGRPKQGGVDRIIEYVVRKGRSAALIENPLGGRGPAVLSLAAGEGWRELGRTRVPFSGPVRWLAEMLATPNLANRHLQGDFTVVCADPLNFAAVVPLLRPGRPGIFLAVDYSPRRFPGRILNAAYRKFFFRAVRRAAGVWAASEPVAELCRAAGGGGKVAWLPNSPFYDEIPRIPPAERDPGELVLIGHLSASLDRDIVSGALRILGSRGIPARLTVIGSGARSFAFPSEGPVRNLGMLPRSEALAAMAGGGLGLAFYGGDPDLDRYRDSIKIREYAAAGLPVLCDGATPTAREGAERGACWIVADSAELAAAVERLCADRALYAEVAGKALAWAREMDKGRILEKLLPLEGDGPCAA
ncbi:MAG TPA: glycosyltransferase [bacterium]|nr:glycosyltransferase [bacterium]HPJ72187.1 glycosyltransferase [bacterium]HPQ67177.1 glycosyltransferase [bacterium]